MLCWCCGLETKYVGYVENRRKKERKKKWWNPHLMAVWVKGPSIIHYQPHSGFRKVFKQEVDYKEYT